MVVKLCINDVKTGKSYNKELSENELDSFMSKKINDKIEGHYFGFSAYEFKISGGSDNAGFPMRFDVDGMGRKRILLTKGIGVKTGVRGMKRRKLVRGNTINQTTNQINLKVLKYGNKSIAEVLGIEEKPAEAKAESAEIKEKSKE